MQDNIQTLYILKCSIHSVHVLCQTGGGDIKQVFIQLKNAIT